MIQPIDYIPPQNLFQLEPESAASVPYWEIPVPAGFSSPADNFIRERLNLHDLCVTHPDCTHFVRATGESMIGDYIFPGSILVVDSALPVETGRVIVAWVNEGWCVKRFVYQPPMVMLVSSNSEYLPIYVHPKRDVFKVLGVVTYCMSSTESGQVRVKREEILLSTM